MKKLLYVFVLVLLLVPFVSNATSLPAGCKVGYKFSATTGKPCSTTPVTLSDCAPGHLFSAITGKSCNVQSNSSVGGNFLTTQQLPVVPIVSMSTLTQEYNSKFQALEQQIIDLKTQYYTKKAAIETSRIAIEDINGRIQQLINQTNDAISKIQLQEQQLYLDYQVKLSAPTTSNHSFCSSTGGCMASA